MRPSPHLTILTTPQAQFSQRVRTIARPTDADTATCRGAAEYGLSRRELVSSIVVPRAYVMKVKLPAEPEDYQQRPHFVTTNAAGAAVCENRCARSPRDATRSLLKGTADCSIL